MLPGGLAPVSAWYSCLETIVQSVPSLMSHMIGCWFASLPSTIVGSVAQLPADELQTLWQEIDRFEMTSRGDAFAWLATVAALPALLGPRRSP